MTIFSLIIAAAYSVLIQVSQQSSDIQARDESVGQARNALEQLDTQIRSGNVLFDPAAEALPLSMRIYTQANGVQKCVQWQVLTSTRTLRVRSWATDWQTGGAVSGWSTVARSVLNETSDAIKPFALQGGSTSYGSRLIDITLYVKDPKANGNRLTVATSMAGRNTVYGYDAGICSPTPTP